MKSILEKLKLEKAVTIKTWELSCKFDELIKSAFLQLYPMMCVQSNTSWKSCCQIQVEQVQHACECHVCNQDPTCTNLGSTTCLPPSRLHTAPPPTVGHQFFTDSKTPSTHPALHLYPHIHGHLPLHNFSRPLLHPTLYPPSPPLTHNKVRKEYTLNLPVHALDVPETSFNWL